MGGSAAGLPQGVKMNILRLEITRAGQAGAGLPDRLTLPGFFSEQDAVNSRRPRRFDLTMHMAGLINGRTFGMEAVASDEVVRLGDLEVWEFANLGGGMGMMGGWTSPIPCIFTACSSRCWNAAWRTARLGAVQYRERRVCGQRLEGYRAGDAR